MDNSRYCYIVDTGCNPMIHYAKDDKSFMKYFVKNIDDYEHIFITMFVTNSLFIVNNRKLFSVKTFDDENISQTLKKIKKVIKKMTFDDFCKECNGDNCDGGDIPCISIYKRLEEDIFIYIS
jgi:hypothetical protein